MGRPLPRSLPQVRSTQTPADEPVATDVLEEKLYD